MPTKSSHFTHYITVQLVGAIFLLLLPMVLLSCVINYQFMRDGMEQVRQSHTRVLENDCSQLDREMDLAENYMNAMIISNGTTIYLTDRTSERFYYAAHELDREMQKTALYYSYISGFFLSAPDSDFLYTYLADTAFSDNDAVRDCLKSLAGGAPTDGWQAVDIDGTTYLLQCFSGGGLRGGALINLESLPALLEAGADIGICTEEELNSIRAALPKNQTLLWSPSEKCAYGVYEILDESEALSTLPFLQRYFAVISILMLLCVPLLIAVLHRLILAPLHRLTHAMQSLQSGNWETRMAEETSSAEFRQIGSTFNHMVREIQSLKIAVYEEQMETQKTRLQNLSYQLRPHFMINSLNMAYNMIISRDYETAAKLMRFSASYMRYLLRLQDDFVPLQEELRHLRDYLDIQLLRYEGQFRYEFAVEPFVEDIAIPSMILQNFIENSVKYSIGPDHFTLIQLIVDYDERDDIPYAVVMVRDNGAGYPDWLLDALQREDMDALRDRVGLRNTIQRIKMLYGSRAQYRFYNNGGAITEFFFPLDEEDG